MNRFPHRQGFTLFQLLVVIVVLLLLLGLMLPAVGKVREAAARAQSANNLKQLALAVHNYYSAFEAMPPGVSPQGYSAMAQLLPFVEQEAIYRQIDFKRAADDKANDAFRKIVLRMLLSPLDDAAPIAETGPTNYLFNAGTKPALADNDGPFPSGPRGVRFTTITDGTSNTVMAAETLRGNGIVKAETPLRQHVALKADALQGIKPEAGVADWKADKNIAGDRGSAWLDGKLLQGTFTATLAVNDEKPDVTCGGVGGLVGIRTQGNGFNAALCDGSVRFVSKGVEFKTWQALSTRAGGEVIGNDF